MKELVMIEKDGKTHRPVIISEFNMDLLANVMMKSLTFRLSKNDPELFIVIDPKVNEVDMSLSNLKLFDKERDESNGGVVWDLITNVKSDPYSATLTAFSKLTDKLIYR